MAKLIKLPNGTWIRADLVSIVRPCQQDAVIRVETGDEWYEFESEDPQADADVMAETVNKNLGIVQSGT